MAEQLPTERTEASGAQAERSETGDELTLLRARLAEVQRERDHLIAAVDILQDISGSLHFVDILQTISRKLGETFSLDRCALFLNGEAGELRLVASYEDPSIRNLVVDINRYPELKRVFQTGETVFIHDALSDPMMTPVRAQLELRDVRSIVVTPLEWQGSIIGAIFLRTSRKTAPFTDADVRFCQVVASLTAKALRNAHRFESVARQEEAESASRRRADLERIALLAFVRRLLDRYNHVENESFAEGLLPRDSDEELDRLVSVAMQVFEEQARK